MNDQYDNTGDQAYPASPGMPAGDWGRWDVDQGVTASMPPVHPATEPGAPMWAPGPGESWPQPGYEPWAGTATGGAGLDPYQWTMPEAQLPPLPAPREIVYAYPSPYDTDIKRGMPMWHIPILITVAVLCAAAFGAGGYAFGRWGGGGQAPVAYAPAPAAAAVVATATQDASVTVDTSSTAVDTGPAPDVSSATAAIAKAPPVAQASMVAYRKDGYFWVADEKGGSQKKLNKAPSAAAFAISPNGNYVAVADGDNGILYIVDAKSGATVKVAGAADTVRPSWAPNSSFVVYCGTDSDKRVIKQVGVDGKNPIVLTAGTSPRVAPDGKTVYFVQMPGADEFGPVALVEAGKANGKTTVVVRANVQEVAVVQKGIVYAAAEGDKGLYRAALDGSGAKLLVAVPKQDGADSFSNLFVTRDGKWVAYDVSGAQGFARLGAITFDGGSAKDLSGGKDSYAIGWLADGSAVTYTTGNISVDPKAKSDLAAVAATGANRRVIVAGAGQ